jgi:hypothetical protein
MTARGCDIIVTPSVLFSPIFWKGLPYLKKCVILRCKNVHVMEPVFDTIEEIDLATKQDELTPEQRDYWLKSIERDMRNMDQQKKYITLEQFGQELMAAVRSKI